MKRIKNDLLPALLLAVLLLLTGCTEKEPAIDGDGGQSDHNPEQSMPMPEMGEMTSFFFNYDNAFGGCGYIYRLRKEADGTVIFSYFSDMYREMEDLEMEVEPEVFSAVENLIQEREIWRWDGFDEVDANVLDGDGFSLYVEYDNDYSIDASGSNEFPKGYGDFSDELNELLVPYGEQLIENMS